MENIIESLRNVELNHKQGDKQYNQKGVYFTFMSKKYGDSVGRVSAKVIDKTGLYIHPDNVEVIIIQTGKLTPYVCTMKSDTFFVEILDRVKPQKDSFSIKSSLFNLNANLFKARLHEKFKTNPEIQNFFSEQDTKDLLGLKEIVKQKVSDIRHVATGIGFVYRDMVKSAKLATAPVEKPKVEKPKINKPNELAMTGALLQNPLTPAERRKLKKEEDKLKVENRAKNVTPTFTYIAEEVA